MAGTTFTALAGLLIRHEIDLVSQLRAAQPVWPTKPGPPNATASLASCMTSSPTP